MMDLLDGLAAIVVAWFINKVRLAVWSLMDLILILFKASPELRCLLAHELYLRVSDAHLKMVEQGEITDHRTVEWLKRFHLRNFDRLEKWQAKVRGFQSPDTDGPSSPST